MTHFKLASLASIVVILSGCQSTKQIENSFDPAFIEDSADLTFSSPNFSPLHAPPLMSGMAYIETYKKKEFCDSDALPIGKVTITRANKTQFSKLPSGDIIANIAYHAVGATGSGLTGNTYFKLNVEPNQNYTITLTEARPLVTSYSIDITRGAVGQTQEKVPNSKARTKKAICTP